MIYLLLASRWLLAIVLLAAGFSKVSNRAYGTEVFGRYGIVPDRLVPVGAALLPWCEIAVGAALAFGIQPALMAFIAAALFTAFALAVAWNLLHGRRFDCGCGFAESPISWSLFSRNILLAAIAGLIGAGPAAGLSLWTGWAARTWPVPVGWKLVPVPLTVLVAVGAARCARVGWEAWRSARPGPDAARHLALLPGLLANLAAHWRSWRGQTWREAG